MPHITSPPAAAAAAVDKSLQTTTSHPHLPYAYLASLSPTPAPLLKLNEACENVLAQAVSARAQVAHAFDRLSLPQKCDLFRHHDAYLRDCIRQARADIERCRKHLDLLSGIPSAPAAALPLEPSGTLPAASPTKSVSAKHTRRHSMPLVKQVELKSPSAVQDLARSPLASLHLNSSFHIGRRLNIETIPEAKEVEVPSKQTSAADRKRKFTPAHSGGQPSSTPSAESPGATSKRRKKASKPLEPSRRPTAENAYYSISEDAWNARSESHKRPLSHVGWIEETDAGMDAPQPCSTCTEPEKCRVYKPDAVGKYFHVHGSTKWLACARCRHLGRTCSFVPA